MRYIFSFIIIFILSCSRTSVIDDIVFPVLNEKITVFCLLTPSDSIKVSIRTVRSVIDKSKEIGVENAMITIEDTESQKIINIPHILSGGFYGNSQGAFKILPNHTYLLKVTTINSLVTQSAICKVPSSSATFEKFTYGDPFSDGNSMRRRIEARWQDVSSSEQNLNYLISSGGKFKDIFSGEILNIQPSLKSYKDISQSKNILFYISTVTDDSFPKNYYLHTMENNLYQFQKMAQQMDEISRKGTGNFLGAYQGVIPEFTNIQNGYGIFGAYLTTSQVIIFK